MLLPLLRQWGEQLLNLVYPPHCVFCKTATSSGREVICPACRATAKRVLPPFCQVCSRPFDGVVTSEFTCPRCRETPPFFDCAVAPYRSDTVVREAIHRFKYNGQYYLRHLLAEWLMEAWNDSRLCDPRPDGIVAVPLHPARKRARGFNQSAVLAKIVSQQTGIPLVSGLERIRFTPSQTQFHRPQRIENLRFAFKMRQTERVQNRHLLLIDDVLTTGSTVHECARALKAAGAASVRVATVARG